MLLFASAFILSADVNYTVRVDIKGNLNLRYASRSGSDSVEYETSERGISACHFALSLKNVNFNRCLTVSCSRIYLALLNRYRRVAVDYSCLLYTSFLARFAWTGTFDTRLFGDLFPRSFFSVFTAVNPTASIAFTATIRNEMKSEPNIEALCIICLLYTSKK